MSLRVIGTSIKPIDWGQGLLHLVVLFVFALAQPLFDLLSRNAEFFAVRHSLPQDIVLITAFLCLVPPLPAIGMLALIPRCWQRIRSIVFGGLLMILMAVIILPPINAVTKSAPGVALVGSLIGGLVFLVGYYRYYAIRLFLTVLSPSILLLPLLFLFNSPVNVLLDASAEIPGSGISVPGDTTIVMVVFDELPLATLMDSEGNIDEEWFPGFASLAKQATWYRNASTVADYTTYAVPPILTGQYPNAAARPGSNDPKADFNAWFGMPIAHDHPNNLFTLLGGSYRLQVFEPLTSLCPKNLCESKAEVPGMGGRLFALFGDLGVVYAHLVTPPGLSSGLPPVTLGWSGFLAEYGVQQADDERDFLQFVDAIEASPSPTLYFHHSTLPHTPWVFLPDGTTYDGNRILGLSGDKWGGDEFLIDQSFQRHVLQARFADRLLGMLLERLRREGLFEHALIIVTADHGASFQAGSPMREVRQDNFRDIISVPLFIKDPFQSMSRVDDRPAQTIDILPTIADMLEVDLPFTVDGLSLLKKPVEDNEKRVIFGKKGQKLAFSYDFTIPSKLQARKLRLKRSADSEHGLMQLFPYKKLVGKPLAEANIQPIDNIEIKIKGEKQFRNYAPAERHLPLEIHGEVSGPSLATSPPGLMVVVNGIIRGVTRSAIQGSNKAPFSSLIPSASFVKGENDLLVIPFSLAVDKPGKS